MTRRGALALLVVVAAACADLIGVRADYVQVVLVPRFSGFAEFGDNADQLRIRVQRDSSGTFLTIKDTTVAIDPESGQAAATMSLLMLTSPQQFRVLLDAIRSSDGVVLFHGEQVISVNANPTGGTPPTFDVPGGYVGPGGAFISVTPADTAVAPGVTFPLVTVVLDSLEQPVAVPITYALAVPADSTILTVGRLTGVVTTRAGANGEARVVARSADGLQDTARIFVGSTPAAVRVTPGVAHLLAGGTQALTGDVLDGGGNVLSGFAVTWTSRTPAVATVSGAGLVTAAAAGGATLVGTSNALADSMRVVVAPSGNVVAGTRQGTRFFRTVRVGDTVHVDLVADMQFTGGELLGSFNATLAWDPAVLAYEATLPGTFGGSINFNPGTGNCSAQLCVGGANGQGAGGLVTLARVRFRALAAGAAGVDVGFGEMSAAVTFTNLITRISVAVGAVTVVP